MHVCMCASKEQMEIDRNEKNKQTNKHRINKMPGNEYGIKLMEKDGV